MAELWPTDAQLAPPIVHEHGSKSLCVTASERHRTHSLRCVTSTRPDNASALPGSKGAGEGGRPTGASVYPPSIITQPANEPIGDDTRNETIE